MQPGARFARAVLSWFDQHGRQDLPWQQDSTPYRVWVSEIMLQQTQVSTVVPYYERFMSRFPTLNDLAGADIDTVLGHWAGLGYYARGRNLHRCAQVLVERHGGAWPDSIEAMGALPGIGRSTAGAILSLAMGKPEPILDGNVKRVLARHFAVAGWPGESGVSKALWVLSEAVTPATRTGDFNQAMMDMGATLCTRTRPACQRCPVADSCQGLATGTPQQFPGSKPKKDKPVKATVMLALRDASGAVLLERRPASGIWGGLWSLPEIRAVDELAGWLERRGLAVDGLALSGLAVSRSGVDRSGVPVGAARSTTTGRGAAESSAADEVVARLRHTFSHYHLDIEVLELHLPGDTAGTAVESRVGETRASVWWDNDVSPPGGLPAPVVRILKTLTGELL